MPHNKKICECTYLLYTTVNNCFTDCCANIMCLPYFVIFPFICLPCPRDHGHCHTPSKAVAPLLVCRLVSISHWRRPSYPLTMTCAAAPPVVRLCVMPLCCRISPRSCPSVLALLLTHHIVPTALKYCCAIRATS